MDDATSRPGDPFAAVYGCALAVTHIVLTNFRSYARGEISAGACPVASDNPELRALLSTDQLIELPMLVGHYILLAGTLESLGVPLDGAPDAAGPEQ